jgi:hypothetical protein
MNSGVIVDFPWYPLRVKNRHENVVASSLEAKGYACFLPVYRSSGRGPGKRGEAVAVEIERTWLQPISIVPAPEALPVRELWANL